MATCMERDNFAGTMGPCMKVNILWGIKMDQGSMFMGVARYTMGNGEEEKRMVMESTCKKMVA